MNLFETVQLIQQQAVTASGAKDKCVVLTVPGAPAHKQFIGKPDGTFATIDVEPQPRKHSLASLDEAIVFINKNGEEGKTVVWFDVSGIVVVMDDSTRRDIATLPLTFTPVIDLLTRIEADGDHYDQKDFRRLLRVDLANARRDDKLLNWVSNAKFATATTVGGVVTSSKESLGRDVNDAALSSAGDFPEEIGLDVRVFDDASLKETWGVKCAVELFLREAEFTLTPYPLEIHNAIESEVDVIGQKLRASVKVPVFRGKP